MENVDLFNLDMIKGFKLSDGQFLYDVMSNSEITKKFIVLSFKIESYTYFFDFELNLHYLNQDSPKELGILFNTDLKRKKIVKNILN